MSTDLSEALVQAADSGHIEVVKRLLAEGTDPRSNRSCSLWKASGEWLPGNSQAVVAGIRIKSKRLFSATIGCSEWTRGDRQAIAAGVRSTGS